MVFAARYHNHTLLGSRDRVLAIQEPRDRLARDPENSTLLLLSQHSDPHRAPLLLSQRPDPHHAPLLLSQRPNPRRIPSSE
jgi:hypothetical protein